jgi:NAD(P)H-hydrate epimerase
MTRSEVRDFDTRAINQMHIPGVVLMENAGRGCAEVIVSRLESAVKAKVCIFCGTGNNGGDGYVIARHLANQGADARIVICGDAAKVSGDALVNLRIIRAMNLPVEDLDIAAAEMTAQIQNIAAECDMIVDAIFGTGLKGELRSEYAQLITCINAQPAPIIAVDIPSGLDCDTGLPMPVSIEAQATVTFVAVKKGFAACAESAQATGEVYIASIGIEPDKQ